MNDHDYHGAVVDVDLLGDHCDITLYYDDDAGMNRFHHTSEDIADADIITALVLVEKFRPGVLHAALAAVRPADTHN